MADEGCGYAAEGKKVFRLAFVASVEASAAAQPGHRSLDYPAVATEPLRTHPAPTAPSGPSSTVQRRTKPNETSSNTPGFPARHGTTGVRWIRSERLRTHRTSPSDVIRPIGSSRGIAQDSPGLSGSTFRRGPEGGGLCSWPAVEERTSYSTQM